MLFRSVMVSIFLGFTILLISGLFYPVDFLPVFVKYPILILPTNFEINILNNALVLNSDLALMKEPIFYLLIYIGLLCAFSYFLIKKKD